MRYVASALMIGCLILSPGLAIAQSTPTKSAAAKPAKAAEHSVRGTIKSIDGTSLMLGGSGKKAADTHFVLNASTQREGTLAVGSTVSVRYHEEGGSKIATAVVAQPAKEAKSSTASKTSSTSKTKS